MRKALRFPSQIIKRLTFSMQPSTDPLNSPSALTTTAWELKELLEANQVRSVDLVKLYLSQIQKHNHNGANLRAMVSTVPTEKILATAERLDQERAKGNIRSPLHGIPIIIKVCKNSILVVPVFMGYSSLRPGQYLHVPRLAGPNNLWHHRL